MDFIEKIAYFEEHKHKHSNIIVGAISLKWSILARLLDMQGIQ